MTIGQQQANLRPETAMLRRCMGTDHPEQFCAFSLRE